MALSQVAEILEAEGIETVNMWIGNEPVRGCIGCGACAQKGRCVFHDSLYEEILAVLDAGVDALVVGTPVYFAGPNGSLCAIEGITSPDGRVFGKMCHAERVGKHLYKNIPGPKDMHLFVNAVKYFK